MRTSLRATTLALALSAAATLPAAAQNAPASGTRIAYVNTQALLQAAPGRAEAEQAYEREMAGFRDQVKRMSDSLNAMIADYQKVQATLPAAQKETREKAIRSKQEEYQQRSQALEQQAAQRQDALMQPIMENVRKALEDIRSEDGYGIIFSNDAGNSPIVVADKNLDITERVVGRLRTMAVAKPATPSPAKPAPAQSAPAGVTRKP
jgi:outer membrane protein